VQNPRHKPRGVFEPHLFEVARSREQRAGTDTAEDLCAILGDPEGAASAEQSI